MKKSIITIAIVGLTSVFFVSCSNASNTKSSDEAPFATSNDQSISYAAEQGQSNPEATNATPQSGEVKLNPPHGEPGHRCDIQVGEPLSSAPASSAPAAAPMMTTQPSSPVAAPQPQGENVKLNPEHGQPGHRCDIAVGAPLG